MSLRRISTLAVANAGAPTATRQVASSAGDLLRTIGAYIPSDVTTAYVAVAGGMAAVPHVSTSMRLAVAVTAAVLASFATWVLAQRNAQERAVQLSRPAPSALTTLLQGWYEIAAAGVALFAWATAMPGSWVAWGNYSAVFPPALVTVVSLAIPGLAFLLNRNMDPDVTVMPVTEQIAGSPAAVVPGAAGPVSSS